MPLIVTVNTAVDDGHADNAAGYWVMTSGELATPGVAPAELVLPHVLATDTGMS